MVVLTADERTSPRRGFFVPEISNGSAVQGRGDSNQTRLNSMANHSLIHDISIEAGKASPPLAATGAYLMGLPISDWVAIITLLYLALQIGLLVPKYRYQFAQWRQSRREVRKCSRNE